MHILQRSLLQMYFYRPAISLHHQSIIYMHFVYAEVLFENLSINFLSLHYQLPANQEYQKTYLYIVVKFEQSGYLINFYHTVTPLFFLKDLDII